MHLFIVQSSNNMDLKPMDTLPANKVLHILLCIMHTYMYVYYYINVIRLFSVNLVPCPHFRDDNIGAYIYWSTGY